MIVGLIVLVLFVITLVSVLRGDDTWQLHLTAQTEIVEFDLTTPTLWRTGRAVICQPNTSEETADVQDDESVCGGASWEPLPASALALSRELELRADEKNPISVRISSGPSFLSHPSVLVRMTLRRDGTSLGILREISRTVEQLPSELNIFWLRDTNRAQASITVLPFSGVTRVGHDVTTSVGEMLRGGRLAVFAASDEALTGRSVAEESELALGDHVSLNGIRNDDGDLILPKGFIRFTSLDPIQEVKMMDVVMFARAEAVKVDRYGGGNFSFQASWWVKIKHKSTIVIAIVLLTGLLTLISSLVNIIQAIPDIRRWLSRSGWE